MSIVTSPFEHTKQVHLCAFLEEPRFRGGRSSDSMGTNEYRERKPCFYYSVQFGPN